MKTNQQTRNMTRQLVLVAILLACLGISSTKACDGQSFAAQPDALADKAAIPGLHHHFSAPFTQETAQALLHSRETGFDRA